MKLPTVLLLAFTLAIMLFAIPHNGEKKPPPDTIKFARDTTFLYEVKNNLKIIEKHVENEAQRKIEKAIRTDKVAKDLKVIAEERLESLNELKIELEEVKKESAIDSKIIPDTVFTCDTLSILNKCPVCKKCGIINI